MLLMAVIFVVVLIVSLGNQTTSQTIEWNSSDSSNVPAFKYHPIRDRESGEVLVIEMAWCDRFPCQTILTGRGKGLSCRAFKLQVCVQLVPCGMGRKARPAWLSELFS